MLQNQIDPGRGYQGPKLDFGKLIQGKSQITPLQRLQYTMERDARDFRRNLPSIMATQRDNLVRNADSTLSTGLSGVRQGMNSRGMLYSGLRQGEESGLRGRVSSLLAQQIADSNAEVMKEADTRNSSYVSANLKALEAARQRQEEIEKIRTQNQIARAQHMQQLAQMGGYALGQGMGGGQTAQQPAAATSQRAGNQYAVGRY